MPTRTTSCRGCCMGALIGKPRFAKYLQHRQIDLPKESELFLGNHTTSKLLVVGNDLAWMWSRGTGTWNPRNPRKMLYTLRSGEIECSIPDASGFFFVVSDSHRGRRENVSK